MDQAMDQAMYQAMYHEGPSIAASQGSPVTRYPNSGHAGHKVSLQILAPENTLPGLAFAGRPAFGGPGQFQFPTGSGRSRIHS